MAKIRAKGLIAKKIGMTRALDASGNIVAVTLLQIPEQKVTKVLTEERDGYTGYQVGFQIKAEKNLTKADTNRLARANIDKFFSKFKEFRTTSASLRVGDPITAQQLEDVSAVDATGLTKGRGFQGATKRWNSAIGRMTHGSHFHRRPGSLGQNTSPGRCFKRRKMPGHYGVENVTVRNLEVVKLDVDQNVVALKGAVPGHKNSYIELRSVSTVKK